MKYGNLLGPMMVDDFEPASLEDHPETARLQLSYDGPIICPGIAACHVAFTSELVGTKS